MTKQDIKEFAEFALGAVVFYILYVELCML